MNEKGLPMKRVLITGVSSFVGTSVRSYLEGFPDRYAVEAMSMKNGAWEKLDFSRFDVVYHVAGLAHSDVGKLSEAEKARYYEINTDLTVQLAKKAKDSGVGQFIFMSSAIVYGDSAPIGVKRTITAQTAASPANCYGDSKLQAERGLEALADDAFRVVILRCPMIYGKNGKGNFRLLEKLALKMPLFPKVDNARSMLYIKNLAVFVRLMIDNEEQGVFWPCNRELSNTSEMVRMIAACRGKKVLLVPGTAWMLKLLSHATGLVNKAFGNLAYEEHLGDYQEEYRLYSLEESIREIESA